VATFTSRDSVTNMRQITFKHGQKLALTWMTTEQRRALINREKLQARNYSVK